MNFTYPISEAEYVLALIEHNVEDHHDGESDVKAEDGRCGVKVSLIRDKHPGGEYQNPRYAAGRHSHYNRIMELSQFISLFQFFFLGQVYFKETNGIKCKFSQDFQCLSILVKGDNENENEW